MKSPRINPENYAKGMALYNAGKYAEAIQMFGIEIKADSPDIEIIGQVMAVMGEKRVEKRSRLYLRF
jgi:hypothetical protein